MYRVKNGERDVISHILKKYKKEIDEIQDPFLLKDVTFVPVPRSSPLQEGDLWPSLIISEELLEEGYGKDIKESINRIKPVPKSAYAAKGERPTLKDHYDSLQANIEIEKPKKIVLIDDIITKGATTAACYLRLKEAFPDSNIKIFAFIRTRGLVPDIESYIHPFKGKVVGDLTKNDVNREDK